MDILRTLLSLFARCVASLRYRVRVTGLEKVKGHLAKTLVLANHPSLSEPVITIATLWPVLRVRPMLYSVNFQHPLLRWIMKALDAVEVPVMENLSAEAREGAGKAVQQVIEGLRSGENIVMWPAGKIYRQPYERLGGASALAEILRAVPDARIVVIRTRGMWGSMFSYAYNGRNPDIPRCLRAGLRFLITSLVFFGPRREVEVTVEEIERSALPGFEKEQVNPFFDQWYNSPGPEEPVYVPYHAFLAPRSYQFPALISEPTVDFEKIRPATLEAVKSMLEEYLGRAIGGGDLGPGTMLEDLGLDSLGRMEVSLLVQGRFGFAGSKVPATFGELSALAEGLFERGRKAVRPAPPLWFREPRKPQLEQIRGETIQEAFVRTALALRDDMASADDASGALTYERLLITALLLSRRIKALPGKSVGILLPSSTACAAVFFATHMAGMLPVMLNWTTGPGAMAHGAKITGLEVIVTSRAFVDRAAIKVEGPSMRYLEDIKASIGIGEQLFALMKVRLSGAALLRALQASSPDDTAVVLFTSGSEKAPKAVPLTHRNLLRNTRSGLAALKPTRHDSLLAILPPFHSFGLTATLLLPLLSGIKVVHHPDPTDAAALVQKITAYKPTSLYCTPTFLSYILERAGKGQLASLATVVTGAEKCPPSLFRKLGEMAPRAVLFEGYGITECSPIVSLNCPGSMKEGTIGKAAPGVEVKVVDLESFRPLPPGERGMLLVSGPSVFSGYLASDGLEPFMELEGKSWYIAGDLVFIDSEGFITFCGRLKRFLKAGGEMISLPALEEPFSARYPATREEGPLVAVEGLEYDGGRKVVLFTAVDISLAEANAILAEKGMKGIMRIDEVKRLESIPVLGTGKIDYKVLRGLLEER
ncbi:MAG: AMP-binding protein [Candidatus Eremiobacteraeota bacterium]|nr:AMP-binding protein [Candidatus Eremiobacteraeota bacterium]